MDSSPITTLVASPAVSNSQSLRKQWIPLALRLPLLIIFILIDIGLFIGLLVLTIRSATDSGFVKIGGQSVTTLGVNWNLGLLWTTLPTLVFSLFSLSWGCIANAFSDRQPFVELSRPTGAPPKLTVFLEYRTIPALWRWLTAFRNSHHLVGASSLLSLILSIGIVPLSARLFTTRPVNFAQDASMVFETAYSDSGINATTDWIPIFDTVAATLIHSGTPIAWTNRDYAFRSFSVAGSEEQTRTPGPTEMKVNTTAYSASADCSIISTYNLTQTLQDPTTGRIYVDASDRGCEIHQDFVVAPEQLVYFKTTSEIECTSKDTPSRLVFTAGRYNNSSTSSSVLLTDVVVISCIPQYRTTAGILTVQQSTTTQTATPSVVSFAPSTVLQTERPSLWRVFEQNLFGPVALNPQTEWSTTALGNLILNNAGSVVAPKAPLEADGLVESITTVFRTVYLTAVARYALQSVGAADREAVRGVVLRSQTRLFVVPWIVYVVFVSLTVTAGMAVLIGRHVRRHKTALWEEPVGLASWAGLVEGSTLERMAKEVRSSTEYGGRFTKSVKARCGGGGRWGMVGDPGREVIQCDGEWYLLSEDGDVNGKQTTHEGIRRMEVPRGGIE